MPAGFCDQPPSGGSRSLKPARPLKQEAGYSENVGKRCLFLCPLGLATTTVVIYYIKVKFRGRYIQGRYLCTDGGPSRGLRSLNPARPLYPRLQNPMVTVFVLFFSNFGVRCSAADSRQEWVSIPQLRFRALDLFTASWRPAPIAARFSKNRFLEYYANA